MYIYHSKLSNGANYNHAVAGNFSGIRNNEEIIVSRSRVLELYAVNNQGTLSIHCSEYLHFVIRSMAVLNWRDRDFVVIASDSGQAFILGYSPEKNGFLPILKKSYGLPVTLPEHPGQYIAASFGGFLVGSLVENHIFYSLAVQDREKKDPLSITQPRYVMFDLVGINNRTPTFASLEVFCEEGVYDSDKFKQYLKIYEVDLKEKKVAVHSYPLPHHGNKLIYVPEGKSNPDGLIVCYEDMLTFRALKAGYKEIRRYLPQRKNDAFNSKTGFILTSSTLYDVKGMIVVLAQSEQGDLFSIQIKEVKDKELVMQIMYIDTIPVASSLCIVSGKLFVAAEFGDNFLYEIKSLGNESEMIPFRGEDVLVTFVARKLENLSILGCLKSISPVMQSHVFDFACNNLKQFIFACGRGPSSTLRLQRYGIKVSAMYQATPPHFSNSVWSVNEEIEGRCITYIVVSLMSVTMVLALDKFLNVDCDTAFKYDLPTLDCTQCTRDSFIQVYHTGFRLIKSNQFTEYKMRKNSVILRCALHSMQIALALVNKGGMYFEVEDVTGQVSFKQMQTKFKFKSTVLCMQFIPRAIKAKHLAVCFENCMEMYSVDIMEMKCLSTFNLEHIPESIAILSCEENATEFNSLINIGYQDGTLQRIAVNEEVIKSEYSVKLGTKPVKLCVGEFNNNVVVIALSNRAWISFYHRKRMLSLAPLDFKDQINDVAFFSAVCSPSANIVALSNKDVYVLSLNHWESLIEDAVVQLTYTPNILVINPENNFLIISETDRRPPFHKEDEITPQKAMDLALHPPKSPPKSGPKQKKLASVWDSLLHVFDPIEKKTVFKQPLPINETAVSMSLVRFGAENSQYLLVGVKQGLMLEGVNRESHVHIYEVSGDGRSFSLVNKTVVEDVPYAICQIESYVLIGVGNLLCLYSFKQNTKALLKCAVEESERTILAIWSRGNFFVVKTSDEHLTYGYLEVAEASLVMIHEDRFMRTVTCLCFWDDDVIFVADRKRISAVLLPYYEGCERPLAAEDLIEHTEKLSISDPGPSTSRPDETFPEPSDWGFSKGLSSSQERSSTCRTKTSTQVGTSFKIKHSTVKAGSSSQAKPSVSRGGPSSEAGPSTSRAGPSSEAGPSTSRAGASHSGHKTSVSAPKLSRPGLLTSLVASSQSESDYHYPFARFMGYSYSLITHVVGEYVQSIQKASLIEEGRELIVYTTISGTVGILVPFLTETHHKFFGPLEYLISKANPFLSTDWLAPVNPHGKDINEQCYDDQIVIDANVCELFSLLRREVQVQIADKLGASVLEVLQKIEEMKRTKFF